MKFLSIYKAVERNTPPSAAEMANMGKLIEEGMKAGWLVATEGCLPSALGARVRRSSGKINVTDGPFTESKEVVGGFAILKANSKAEAIQLAKDFLNVVGEGETPKCCVPLVSSGFGRTPSSDRINARSIRFCNSRIFPGQSYEQRSDIVSLGILSICRPTRRPRLSTKCSTRAGMSSRRSRSGGN